MKLDELQNDFNLMLEEVNEVRQEFQDLVSSISQDKQGIEDMLGLVEKMVANYNRANACFGFSTESDQWRLSASQKSFYSNLGPTTLSIATAAMAGGVLAVALVAGTSTLVALAASGVLGTIGLAVAVYISRKAKAKRAEAERERQRLLLSCAEGIDDYNRHLGQLADKFVCGKTNKKYEDR